MTLAAPPCPIAPGGVAYTSVPGVRTWVTPQGRELSIECDRSIPAAAGPDPECDAAWDAQRAANPKLFNGPVLSVRAYDPARGTIRCGVDEFKRLAVQPALDRGVVLLAVTVVLLAHDADGRELVVLGQRSPRTRIHGYKWELGPSGGFDVPPPGADRLGERDILAQCAHEMEAELPVPMLAPRVAAVTYEHGASCLDLIVVARTVLPEGPLRPANWEYVDVRAVPLDELPAFDAEHADAIIPPTRALFRFFGWVDG